MNFEGQNISLQDALFVDHITEDLETWRVRSEQVTRVLVFPPVNNYHRFLIHKVVETGFPEFATFSVGEGVDRRTVVCFQQQLLDFTLGNHAFQQAGVGEGVSDISYSKDVPSSENPSWELEVSGTELPRSVAATEEDTGQSQLESHSDEGKSISKMVQSHEEIYEDCEEELSSFRPASGDNLYAEASPRISAGTPSKTAPARCRGRSKRPDIPVYVPPRGRGKPIPCQENVVVNTPVNAQTEGETASKWSTDEAGVINVESSDDESTDSNDATEQVVNEITSAVGGVQIETPTVDYAAFKTSDTTINIDQFGHVIELYDFPQHLKTNDLMTAFHAFTSRWDIKWVDDTHALGVFSSPEVAAEALAMRHPHIKSRPLNMATAQSKCKARAVCEFLLPYKQRPLTSTGPARRLLQWALGSDKKVPAASQAEQDRLKEAIRKKEEERRKRREEEREYKLKLKFSEHDNR
jgi:hypothetical protein